MMFTHKCTDADLPDNFHDHLLERGESGIVVQVVNLLLHVPQQDVLPARHKLHQGIHLQAGAQRRLPLHQVPEQGRRQLQLLQPAHRRVAERIHQRDIARLSVHLAHQFTVSVDIVGEKHQAAVLSHLSYIHVGRRSSR